MGVFKFEDDLLKHHIRTQIWLPIARDRLKAIREEARSAREQRRLKYFTFCAVGAIDVLMLDVARVIRPSAQGFDTVAFFDRDPESVLQTQNNIPGSHGYVGEFTDLVLLDDPEAEAGLDPNEVLTPPTSLPNEENVRERQRRVNERRRFVLEFPFDVINLDIEQFAFRPNDPFPGRVVHALRQLCKWQQLSGTLPRPLDGFSFMFTTQVGPPNISEQYLEMLSERLSSNLSANQALQALLEARRGCSTAAQLRTSNFTHFFALALPKVLASIFMEEDWHVDPERDVAIYAIERPSPGRTYTILHLAMDVRRQTPARNRRAPGHTFTEEATASYQRTVQRLFERDVPQVTEEMLNAEELRKSLGLIVARRKKYNPESNTLP